jgi:hypothetical protein
MFTSNDSSRSARTRIYDRLRGVFRGADPRVCVAFWLFGAFRFKFNICDGIAVQEHRLTMTYRSRSN